MVLVQMKKRMTQNQMMKKILSLLILFSFSYPLELQSKPKGRTYAPEEGTFDRRKRIVIERKCRLIKEQKIPDDVICTYQPQPKEKGEKDKQIYLGSPGFACQKEINRYLFINFNFFECSYGHS